MLTYCACTVQAAVPYVTTLVAGKDVVCRLSISNVQQLVVKLNNATPLQVHPCDCRQTLE